MKTLQQRFCCLLLLATPLAPAMASDLLSAVPKDAFLLVHCQDFAAFNARAQRNDWIRMLGADSGAELYAEMSVGFLDATHTDMDGMLAIAKEVPGEIVLFGRQDSAGFLTQVPTDRATLVTAMRDWLPGGVEGVRKKVVLHGAQVELAEWATEAGGWSGRRGHFAAFVDGPDVLGLFSGDSADAVLASVSASLTGLELGVESAFVSAYREAGGGASGGVEWYIDFTPFSSLADKALESMARDILPDPMRLLGIDKDTWLHATADLYPGSRLDCQVQVHLPTNTLAARLADTFRPLPHSLPAELPKGVESLWALNWSLADFYKVAREGLQKGGAEASVAMLDQGVEAAKGATGVDPLQELLFQLEGTMAFYMLEASDGETGLDDFGRFGFLAHLLDGEVFFEALDRIAGGFGDSLELIELEGADVYVSKREEEFDGGVGFLPKALVVAPKRTTLRRALRAMQGATEASMLDGSRMQAAIDENAGAAFLSVVELSVFRRQFLSGPVPASDGDMPEFQDPFESQLIGTARRVPDGFRLRLTTR